MDVKQATNIELQNELDACIANLNRMAGELGPLLTAYGSTREQADEIVKELKRRGVLREDG